MYRYNELTSGDSPLNSDFYMEVKINKVLINDKSIFIVSQFDFNSIQRYLKTIIKANRRNEDMIIKHLTNLTTKQYNNIKKDINCTCCLESDDWCISCEKEYTHKDRRQSVRHYKSARHKKKHKIYLKRLKSELPTNLICLIFQYTYHFYNIADSSNVEFK